MKERLREILIRGVNLVVENLWEINMFYVFNFYAFLIYISQENCNEK